MITVAGQLVSVLPAPGGVSPCHSRSAPGHCPPSCRRLAAGRRRHRWDGAGRPRREHLGLDPVEASHRGSHLRSVSASSLTPGRARRPSAGPERTAGPAAQITVAATGGAARRPASHPSRSRRPQPGPPAQPGQSLRSAAGRGTLRPVCFASVRAHPSACAALLPDVARLIPRHLSPGPDRALPPLACPVSCCADWPASRARPLLISRRGRRELLAAGSGRILPGRPQEHSAGDITDRGRDLFLELRQVARACVQFLPGPCR
jgi:hypothetical protein